MTFASRAEPGRTAWGQAFLRRTRRLGMLPVLIVLFVTFSVLTLREHHSTGESAAISLAMELNGRYSDAINVVIAVTSQDEDKIFADRLQAELGKGKHRAAALIIGEPRDARRALAKLDDAKEDVRVILCTMQSSQWLVFRDLGSDFPRFASTEILRPRSYTWPSFLTTSNLLNIANQISVIAVVAIGMTMVIITGGIDLSVGSLIGLSAVVTAWLIQEVFGGANAEFAELVAASLAGISVAAFLGLMSGSMILLFRVPPFIVTLAVMLVGNGLANTLTQGESINQIPESFVWLARRSTLFGIPNAVVLMVVLYALAHLVMTRLTLGRYLLAVGGNREAARLSGVPVSSMVLVAYVMCGALAGLGGVLMTSNLQSAAPNFGTMYELYVIAAAVVGGTSLAGGRGSMLGTLMGAFVIAVIQNGMNLTEVSAYNQKVILGLVILGAVLLDSDRLRGEN